MSFEGKQKENKQNVSVGWGTTVVGTVLPFHRSSSV